MNARDAGFLLGTRQADEHLRRDGRAWATGQVLRDYAVGDWFKSGRSLTEEDDAPAFIEAYERAYRQGEDGSRQ